MRKDLTLKDIRVPPGGLLNPGLRKIGVDVKGLKPGRKPKIGCFKNLGL